MYLDEEDPPVEMPEAVQTPRPKSRFGGVMVDAEKAVGVAIVGSLAIQIVALLVFVVTGLLLVRNRPRGNLVQLVDGRAIEAGERERNYRHPEVIRRFVLESLYLLFSWDGFLPAGTVEEQINRRPDPGVLLANGRRVPTVAFEASFAFRTGLRENLLLEIGKLVPQDIQNVSVAQDGKLKVPRLARTFLLVDFISQPKAIEDGRWGVDVVSTVYYLPAQGTPQPLLRFNRRLVVAAVQPLGKVLSPELSWYEPLNRTRSSGLQIVEIQPLKL